MKQRHTRHKHSTWRAYRKHAHTARFGPLLADMVYLSCMRPGFCRSLFMVTEQIQAARLEWRNECEKRELQRDAEIAALPRLTRFK